MTQAFPLRTIERQPGALWPSWYSPMGSRMPAPLLIEYVARELKTTPTELTGRSRMPRLCYGRAAIASVLRERGHSTLVIGRILKRDHSSICNALRKIPDYRRDSPLFVRLMASVEMAVM